MSDLYESRNSFNESPESYLWSKPKTEKSCRTVPIPDALVCILKDHKSKQLLESSMLSEWKQTGFVFTSSIGTPMDPRNASKELKPILKAAKLPDIRFHDLRHSNATLMLAHGADLKTVMDHLGHNQIALTANLYVHRVPRLEREAADRMGSLFGG
jgi:integrase